MTSILAPLALTASTGVLLALPLAPALKELLSKRDAGPLVTRKDDGRISNFAASLRTRCAPFLPLLTQCLERSTNEYFQVAQERIFVSGTAGVWSGPQHVDVLALCAGLTELPESFQSSGDFYARNDLRAGSKSLFRALLSEGDILLGERSQILRWVHAESDLHAAANCHLHGRASAGRSITLSAGCKFGRIYSPVIFTSSQATSVETRNASSPFAKLAQAGIGRVRLPGHAHVKAGEEHRGDLVTIKTLTLERKASVLGSVKANAAVHLQEHAEIDGSVVSTRRISIAPGCFVKGPIIAEDEIHIGTGVQVGLPGSPTTISAPRIWVAPGSVFYGTVWARVEGRVGD